MQSLSKLFVLVTLITFSQDVAAQGDRDIDLRTFSAPPGPDALLDAEGTALAGSGRVHLSSTLSWVDQPLVVVDGSGELDAAIVRGRLGMDFGLAVGIVPWLELSAVLPVVLYQDGDTEVSGQAIAPLASTGLGDMRLRAKVSLLSSVVSGVGAGFVVEGSFPTSVRGGFAGDGGFGFASALVVDWRLRGWHIAANVGYRIRPRHEYGDLFVGDELYWHLAGRVPIPRGFGILLGASGAHGMAGPDGPFGAQDENPVTIHLGLDLPALGDIHTQVGGGLGVTSGYGAPRFDLFVTVRYSPRDHDTDGDSFLDHLDLCPFDAEDMDEFIDSDGCPEPDNDEDTILDLDDHCPVDAEDEDGFDDDDGCPDFDNDGDGLEDGEDQCPNEAEDFDGVLDEDGCLDPDTDGDGLDDALDDCPDQAEDMDGFEDEDGCPDRDNDQDTVLDEDDDCPLAPEDLDGFEDDDGCGDPDNDGDGIDDVADPCPDEAEDAQGEDRDGCPEGAERF